MAYALFDLDETTQMIHDVQKNDDPRKQYVKYRLMSDLNFDLIVYIVIWTSISVICVVKAPKRYCIHIMTEID